MRSSDSPLASSSEVPIHLDDESETERNIREINKQIKGTESIPLVDARLRLVGLEIQRIEAEILAAVRHQAGRQQQQLQQHQQQQIASKIEQLLQLSRSAQQVAAMSDDEAAALCNGIKMLDTAKRNIVKSIAALRQLLMIAAAVEQLREAALYRRYKEAAMLLLALNPLCHSFQAYRHIQRVAVLLQQQQQLREGLQQQLLEDFENAVDSSSSSRGSAYWRDKLIDAGACVDALNIKGFREQLLAAICGCLLAPYLTIFSSPPAAAGAAAAAAASDVASSAEATAASFFERRFAWYRRTMREALDLKLKDLLPLHWRLNEYFTAHFCRITRQQLAVSRPQ